MRRLILVMSLLLSMSACAHGPGQSSPSKLPYPAWYVGFAAPRYMEVWVESVDVIDQRGLGFFDVHGGVAGYTRNPNGWHQGSSGGKPINNVDLPEMVFVRWQSLVEPQAYKVGIRIPQWVRDEMVKPTRAFCRWDQKIVTVYRQTITLGMAPGGVVKMWVGGPCVGYMEVGRYQAVIEPLGPYRGESKGKYVPLEPENKAWIEKNGIPYGTW